MATHSLGVLSAALLTVVLNLRPAPTEGTVVVPAQQSKAEQFMAALDPSLGPSECDAAVRHAIGTWTPKDALHPDWRSTFLQAMKDPRTKDSFRFLVYAIIVQRSRALRQSDPDEALGDALSILAEVRKRSIGLSSTQALLLDYCEARLVRECSDQLESLPLFEALSRKVVALEVDDSLQAQELSELYMVVPDEYVRNLMDVGLLNEARRVSRDERTLDYISLSTIASVDLALGVPSRALRVLSGEIRAHDEAAADLLRGVAYAQLGRDESAQSSLEQVLLNEWVDPAANHRRESPNHSLGALRRASLVLAEMAASRNDVDGIRTWIDAVDWSGEVPPLFDARRSALEALWVSASGQPEKLRLEALREMRRGFLRWSQFWNKVPLDIGGMRFLSRPSRRQLLANVIRVELSEGADPEGALQRVLEAQRCGTLARRIGAPSVGVSELQRHVESEGGGVILFLALDEESQIFIVDGDGVSHARGPSRTDLADLNDDLSDLLSSSARRPGDVARLHKFSSKVTRELMGADVMARIGSWRNAVFIGMDRLTHLPPALLTSSGGEWLGCASVVSEWPSAPVGLTIVGWPRQEGGAWRALIEPTPTANPDAPALEFLEEDWERCAAALGGEAHIANGPAAKLDTVEPGTAELLYLHCHGGIEAYARRPGRLFLAGDKATTADDVEDQFSGRRGPTTVILAACHAGLDWSVLGEDGSESLSAAFMFCGARSLIAPRRVVFHERTKEFCLELLGELHESTPIGEAVRRCRATMISRGWDPRDVTGLRLIGAVK